MRKLIMILIPLLSSGSQVAAKETALLKSFGEEFTMKEGETATFKGSKLALKVTGFFKGVCAIPGFNCGIGWKPPMVRYDLILDGKTIDNDFTKRKKRNKEEIYDVVIKESDFKTYAVVSVTPLDEACKTPGTYCWEELAWRTKDASYCEFVPGLSRRKSCQDNIHQVMGE